MTEQLSPELQADFDYTKWGAELRAALSQTLAGVWLRGSRPVPIGPTSPAVGGAIPAVAGATKRISNSAGRLTGWSITLASGAPGDALVELFDGTDNTGNLVASIALTNPNTSPAFEHHGIAFVYGLYCEISGTGADYVRGAIYVGTSE